MCHSRKAGACPHATHVPSGLLHWHTMATKRKALAGTVSDHHLVIHKVTDVVAAAHSVREDTQP